MKCLQRRSLFLSSLLSRGRLISNVHKLKGCSQKKWQGKEPFLFPDMLAFRQTCSSSSPMMPSMCACVLFIFCIWSQCVDVFLDSCNSTIDKLQRVVRLSSTASISVGSFCSDSKPLCGEGDLLPLPLVNLTRSRNPFLFSSLMMLSLALWFFAPSPLCVSAAVAAAVAFPELELDERPGFTHCAPMCLATSAHG